MSGPMSTEGPVVRRRLQGLAFLVVLALLVGLSIATYKKAFTEVVRVTLETDTVGNQLQEAADVKVRGVIVGEVREVKATAEGATIELAIQPEFLDQIPPTCRRGCSPRPCSASASWLWSCPSSPPRSGWPTATSSPRTARENAIELQRVIDDLSRCCRPCSRRTSPTPWARSPRAARPR